MKDWLKENLAQLLVNGVVVIIFGLFGYIWNSNNEHFQYNLEIQQSNTTKTLDLMLQSLNKEADLRRSADENFATKDELTTLGKRVDDNRSDIKTLQYRK